ncbi:MAG: flavodoxin [Myxococcota bacterium]|jgi:flavodoxin I|nr:flavodoxin [Myxococcota bacterium]
MKNVAIVYDTHTGTTKRVAARLQVAFGDPMPRLLAVSETSMEELADVGLLILALPTWGVGDLPDGFEAFLLELATVRFEDLTVAIVGLGDQVGHPDSFVDAMGEVCEKVVSTGVRVVGAWPTSGYRFLSSRALRDGVFVGLPIDEHTQPEQTGARIDAWVAMVQKHL